MFKLYCPSEYLIKFKFYYLQVVSKNIDMGLAQKKFHDQTVKLFKFEKNDLRIWI